MKTSLICSAIAAILFTSQAVTSEIVASHRLNNILLASSSCDDVYESCNNSCEALEEQCSNSFRNAYREKVCQSKVRRCQKKCDTYLRRCSN